MITVLGFYYADGKYELKKKKNSMDFLNSRGFIRGFME